MLYDIAFQFSQTSFVNLDVVRLNGLVIISAVTRIEPHYFHAFCFWIILDVNQCLIWVIPYVVSELLIRDLALLVKICHECEIIHAYELNILFCRV